MVNKTKGGRKMTEKTFNEKVVSVQSSLKAPKGQFNKFGKYNYRSLEDINEAVKPLLAKEGLKLTISDELVLIGDRIYVKSTAHLSDGSEYINVSGYAREAESKKGMDESQITGTASSYARKYALNGLFLIDDTKDADTNENQNERNERSKTQSNKRPPQESKGTKSADKNSKELSNAQRDMAIHKMTEFSNAQSMTIQQATEKLFPYLKINSKLSDLTSDDYGVLMNYLNQHL